MYLLTRELHGNFLHTVNKDSLSNQVSSSTNTSSGEDNEKEEKKP